MHRILVPAALAALVYAHSNPGMRVGLVVPACLAGLFIVCMFCHGLAVRLKPQSRHLTWFYLSISTGGALGGLFVGLFAPAVFRSYFEVQVCVSICLVLALYFLFGYRRVSFLITCGLSCLILLSVFGGSAAGGREIFQGRNFYGVLAVREVTSPVAGRVRMLVHGGTIHGGQMLNDDATRREPGFYYSRDSGAGLVLQHALANRRVGIVGLGVGTIAAYGRPGDYYRFYEINPLALELARSQFTFLADSHATLDVVLGDARLSLESEPSQNFDTLILDAFSGDTIPVHLLTFEAFQTYFRHLKQAGVIAVHVSNEYLNLDPVIAELSAAFGRRAVRVVSAADAGRAASGAEWIIISDNQELLGKIEKTRGAELLVAGSARLWTDQYSNILGVLR